MNPRQLLITGASRGIGLAITHSALNAGMRVLGIARTLPPGLAHNPNFTPVVADLARLDQLPELLKTLLQQHPHIDGLICNAGSGRFGQLEQFSPQHISQLIDLNLTSHILITRQLLPQLKKRKAGDLIFIGSEAALRAGQKGAVYCAAKFGIRGFTQALREECSGSGIRVGIVNPGMVHNHFFDHLDFRPGDQPDQHLLNQDVADAVMLMLNARPGAVIDEINLSPQKKVIQFGKRP